MKVEGVGIFGELLNKEDLRLLRSRMREENLQELAGGEWSVW